MLCPSCRVDLHMSERQGVEIDYCPKCRGVWLDRGELDKILERSRQELAALPGQGTSTSPQASRGSPPPGHSGHPDGYDPRYDKKRRKRSFLEEFFD